VRLPFLETYQLAITPLSPIHIGTGEAYDPSSYVIEDDILFGFTVEQAMEACTPEDRQELLALVSQRDPVRVLLEVQRFFFDRRERLIATARHFVPVRRANATYYRSRLGTETNPGIRNLLDIERTYYDPVTGAPILPGSSLKGAIRTALLDSQNTPREREHDERNANLQQRLFGYRPGSFELDPMRLVQIGDAGLRDDHRAATEVRFALNRKKQRILRDGREILSQAQQRDLSQVLETIRPLQPRAFRCQLNLQRLPGVRREPQARNLPRQDLEWSIEDIARACHRFYLERFEHEKEMLEKRGFVDQQWLEALARLVGYAPVKARIEGHRAFLLRVGRHSGAESVTLNGVRSIKILKGNPEYQAEAKTVWLAGDDPRSSANLIPFGWLLVEVLDGGEEVAGLDPRLESENAERVRTWQLQLEATIQKAKTAVAAGASAATVAQRKATVRSTDTTISTPTDPVLSAVAAFRANDVGRLKQLYEQCLKKPEYLQALHERILELFGREKRRYKEILAKFPKLADLKGNA
jgi:CRISPR-associated protein Csm5